MFHKEVASACHLSYSRVLFFGALKMSEREKLIEQYLSDELLESDDIDYDDTDSDPDFIPTSKIPQNHSNYETNTDSLEPKTSTSVSNLSNITSGSDDEISVNDSSSEEDADFS